MKKELLYLSIFIALFFICRQLIRPTDSALDQVRETKIDELANRYLDLERFSGCILIAEAGEILYEECFGMADYEKGIPFSAASAFNIGELASLMDASILSELLRERGIAQKDSLGIYLEAEDSDRSLAELLRQKDRTARKLKIALIEKLSLRSYSNNVERYCREQRLKNTFLGQNEEPLVMGYQYRDYRGKGMELQAMDGLALDSLVLRSTPRDLLAVLESTGTNTKQEGYTDEDGFSFALHRDIEKQRSIIILSNRRQPVASEMRTSIAALLDGEVYSLPLARRAVAVHADSIKAFSGNYSLNDQLYFEILTEKDSMFLLMGGKKTALIPQSANQFYMETRDASLRFLRDSTQQVDRIVLLDGFLESTQIARRIY